MLIECLRKEMRIYIYIDIFKHYFIYEGLQLTIQKISLIFNLNFSNFTSKALTEGALFTVISCKI